MDETEDMELARKRLALTISQSMGHLLYAAMTDKLELVGDIVARFNVAEHADEVEGIEDEIDALFVKLAEGFEYCGLFVERQQGLMAALREGQD